MFKNYRLTIAIGLSAFLLGCSGEGEAYRDLTDADDVPNTTPAHVHDHDEGPNGGHILEFGTHHGEITMGEDRIVSVYILGDDAKTAQPVENASVTLHLKSGEAMIDVALAAAPLEGEADGQCSKFVAEAGAIPESIKDIEGITGSVDLKIGEATATAKISHDHGDDHGHDH